MSTNSSPIPRVNENEDIKFRENSAWKSPTKTAVALTWSPSLRTQVKTLEKRRDGLENDGKYLEAQVLHEQILKLKLSEESKRKDSLRATRKSQLVTLEETYEEELQLMREQWDVDLKEFEQKVEQGLLDMQHRHEQAINEQREKRKQLLEDAVRAKCPPSKRLLETRGAEKALAKQREYRDAHDLKIKADAMEKLEMIERMDRTKQAIFSNEERLKERLRNELSVFEQRNSVLRANLIETQKLEEDTLFQKFQNKKNDMVSAASRVEGLIDRQIEHLSPGRPVRIKSTTLSVV